MPPVQHADSPASGCSSAAYSPAMTLAGLLGRIEELERDKANTQQLRSDLLQAQTELSEARYQLAELKGSVDKWDDEETSVGRETVAKDRQQQVVDTEGLSNSRCRLVPGRDYPMFIAPDPGVVPSGFAWAQANVLSHITKIHDRDAHTILDKLRLEEPEASDAFDAMIFGNPWHWLEAYSKAGGHFDLLDIDCRDMHV